MPRSGPPRNRIPEWRSRRGMTIYELAARCQPPSSAPTISQLETGRRSLTQGWLERLATALACQPFELLPGTEMFSEQNELLQLWRGLDPAAQARFLALLRSGPPPPPEAPAAPSGEAAPAPETAPPRPRLLEVEIAPDGTYRLTVYDPRNPPTS